ncbi:MAG: DUF3108 domain-containing protein [Gammaproteobacteria bacterium]|nr:DUF3108 domain-containing protein [Gammaproteobacteria bacterium]
MKVLALLTAFGLSTTTLGANGDDLKAYEARYKATAMGLSATAYRNLTHDDDGTYLLQNSLTLAVFRATVGSVTETSRFRWYDGNLIPLQYEYIQTGISSTSERIDFDWENSVARSAVKSESWDLTLAAGYQDKLSYSTRLGQDIAASDLQEFTYQIIDGDEVEEHRYRITAEEIITTPVGNLNTVKIERIRESGSSRRTTVWLARDWDFLLVRLEQVNSSGRLTELNLESAVVGGVTLSGL